jgi:polyisoprenoid-binding protein YceI
MIKTAIRAAAWFGTAIWILGAAAVSAGEAWNVVPEKSSVGFTGVQQGSHFNGRFEDFTAQIEFDPKMPMKGKIVGMVKTASVNTRDHDRDSSLMDTDWFNSAKYPEAKYEADSIKKLDDGSYEADGQLTLKGKTHPVKLTFKFETMDGGDNAKFDGEMMIDRFDFNVGEGWNDTSWVGQNVDVHVMLDLKK